MPPSLYHFLLSAQHHQFCRTPRSICLAYAAATLPRMYFKAFAIVATALLATITAASPLVEMRETCCGSQATCPSNCIRARLAAQFPSAEDDELTFASASSAKAEFHAISCDMARVKTFESHSRWHHDRYHTGKMGHESACLSCSLE
jgi:hypothetical protein